MLKTLFTSAILTGGLAMSATSAQAQNYEGYAQQAQNYVTHANTPAADPLSACKSGEMKRKLIGGAIGGAAGSYAGAKIAGDDDETKGAVIGGLVGGVAGYGLGDKTVDCDPVYEDRYGQPYAASQSQSGAVYQQQPAPSYSQSAPSRAYTQPASYASQPALPLQSGYGERTYVSNHPAYSNPSYGANMQRVYVDRQAPTLTQASTQYVQSQPQTVRYVTPTPQPQPAAPAQYYSQQPATYRTSTRTQVPVRHMMSGRPHRHGKYNCQQPH